MAQKMLQTVTRTANDQTTVPAFPSSAIMLLKETPGACIPPQSLHPWTSPTNHLLYPFEKSRVALREATWQV